jgi:hypothetical protein
LRSSLSDRTGSSARGAKGESFSRLSAWPKKNIVKVKITIDKCISRVYSYLHWDVPKIIPAGKRKEVTSMTNQVQQVISRVARILGAECFEGSRRERELAMISMLRDFGLTQAQAAVIVTAAKR